MSQRSYAVAAERLICAVLVGMFAPMNAPAGALPEFHPSTKALTEYDPAGAAVPAKWRVVKAKRVWQSCAEAADSLNAGAFVADSHSYIDQYSTDPKVTSPKDGFYWAEQTITWKLNPDSSSIVMPDWSWPDMSHSDSQSLRDFVRNLRVHEEGHMSVAEDIARIYSGKIVQFSRSIGGALDNLRLERDKNYNDASAALIRADADYDAVTGHGVNQEMGPKHSPPYPGGDNVILRCSRKGKTTMLLKWHDTARRPYPNGEKATYYTVDFKLTDNRTNETVATWSEEVRVPGGHTHYGCLGSKLIEVDFDKLTSTEQVIEYVRSQCGLEFTKENVG